MALLCNEHAIQKAWFDWAKHDAVAKRAYAIPNAAKRSARLASYMISEGLRKGVLDVHLPVARGGAHSLFIEFKAGSNKRTAEQEQECQLLVADGFAVAVAWDTVLAIEFTKRYLAGAVGPGLTLLKSSTK